MKFMKKPCPDCPYRTDVEPFLTPERGEELAYIAENPFNTFPCHTTTVSTDDGERMVTADSKVCAGFLSLQHNVEGETAYDDDGFKPSPLVYAEPFDMAEAYKS